MVQSKPIVDWCSPDRARPLSPSSAQCSSSMYIWPVDDFNHGSRFCDLVVTSLTRHWAHTGTLVLSQVIAHWPHAPFRSAGLVYVGNTGSRRIQVLKNSCVWVSFHSGAAGAYPPILPSWIKASRSKNWSGRTLG